MKQDKTQIIALIIIGLIFLAACQNTKQSTEENTMDLAKLEIGHNIAKKTKAQLGKNLMTAIQQFGTIGAIEFCNTRAIPITDSMSQVLEATVSRVSDKPRNPKNIASGSELKIIRTYKEKLANQETLEPVLVEGENTVVGYYPIKIGAMCLQCHGQRETTLNAEILAKITSLYPTDQATGYGNNELRGLFKVEMSKK